MRKQVLFIQGGGDGGYEADAVLATSLQQSLGAAYEVIYPRMQTDDTAPDLGWLNQIEKEIGQLRDDAILAAHSLGASLLLKCLSERKVAKRIDGIFLMATPFWRGEEEWVQGLQLREDFAESLPPDIPVFFYHCRDDEEVPFDHLAWYRQKVASATFCEMKSGGHQLGNDPGRVATDIKNL